MKKKSLLIKPKVYLLIATVLISFLVSSCGFYRATTQEDNQAAIQIMGETQGLTLQLDQNPVIQLETLGSFDLYGKKATKIQLAPGTHTYQIFKKNQLIAHRKIFIASGEVVEVAVP